MQAALYLYICYISNATSAQSRLQIYPGASGNDAQCMMNTTADKLLVTAAGTEAMVKRHCTAAVSK